MAIKDTYKDILTEEILKAQLESNEIADADDIDDEVESLSETYDLSIPQFLAKDFHIEEKETASASKFNGTFTSIRQDMRVLYKETVGLTSRAINSYERWKLEAESLEKRLTDLEDHIDDLLLLSQDTEGYHSFIIDNFTDSTLLDLNLTTASFDLKNQLVTLTPPVSEPTRVFIDPQKAEATALFKNRTTTGFISKTDSVNSKLSDVFSQTSNTWWTKIDMSLVKTVVCELTVDLADEPISLSKIVIYLHESSQSSPMTIVPLYSLDNYTFTQLPTPTYTQDVKSKAIFTFSTIQAKHIKFLLTKKGPDPTSGTNFSYQFGFKEISFYNDTYQVDETEQFISKPLSILDNNSQPVKFSKITLETCERLEEGTDIRYFIAPFNDVAGTVTSSTSWFPISPVNRSEHLYPQVLSLGEKTEITIGVDETLGISYDSTNTDSEFINPAPSFNLLSVDIDGNVLSDTVTTPDLPRYSFINSNERILSYQIKDKSYSGSGTGGKIELNESTILLFRNVGEKGLEDIDTDQVRDIQRGWGFTEPYYTTTIQILNPNGITMDVGNEVIVIDENEYTNKIDKSVLSGKTETTDGIHTIKVHKNNWGHVTPGLESLSALKEADILYPFNHKLLIEGYDYGEDYPSIEEDIYQGVDLFAEFLMRSTSIMDLIKNIPEDNYQFYALDRDAPGTHSSNNLGTRVFVIKIDNENPDFINEKFVLKFNLLGQRYKYFRLRADFSTTDARVTPALDAYKLKLGD